MVDEAALLSPRMDGVYILGLMTLCRSSRSALVTVKIVIKTNDVLFVLTEAMMFYVCQTTATNGSIKAEKNRFHVCSATCSLVLPSKGYLACQQGTFSVDHDHKATASLSCSSERERLHLEDYTPPSCGQPSSPPASGVRRMQGECSGKEGKPMQTHAPRTSTSTYSTAYALCRVLSQVWLIR
jgi:hypothetical protein